MRSSSLHLLIFSILLIQCMGNVCTSADQLECTSTLCPNYYWYNSTCRATSGSLLCQPGEMPTSWNNTLPSQKSIIGSCTSCQLLQQSNCTTTCPGYIWTNQGTSASFSCQSCQSLFGTNCIRCTQSACLACAYSSTSVLNPAMNGCVNEKCSVANCLDCYDNGAKCAVCLSGYQVDSNFSCATSTCTITQCAVCEQNLCARCNQGYSPSTDKKTCQPICSDIFCSNCIGPGICGSCLSPYNPDTTGTCIINCQLISVSNCQTCSSAFSCTKCKSGYALLENGALCQGSCQVSNCQFCFGDVNNCTSCMAGYDLVVNSSTVSCTQGICVIDYCQTCLNVSACSSCISGFTLSTDQTNCASQCSSTLNISNCLFCNTTNCLQCQSNYILTSNTCILPCASIQQCTSCYTSSLCSSCSEGYTPSADHKSCMMVCLVDGCLSCTSPTALACLTCKNGYSEYIDSNGMKKCAANCAEGQVNTGLGTVNCQNCDASISFCMTCSYSSTYEVIAQSCQEGYFVSGNICTKCSTALANCFKCTTSITCEQCEAGYNVVSGICVSPTACPANVVNCKACNAMGGCDKCSPGFGPSGLSCVRVSCPDTYNLDSNDKCVCPTGAYQSENSCKPCSDQRCTNCTINICQACAIGFYPLGSTCKACIPNCKICHTGTTCQTCQADYSKVNNGQQCIMYGVGRMSGVISQSGSVIQCQWGCRVCITGAMSAYQTICTVPRPGYSIVAGQIVRCQSPCRTCLSYDRTRCTSCYSRYTNVQGNCTRCSDVNALTCSSFDPTFSYTCRQGYVVGFFVSSNTFGGQCLPCSAYCRSCSGSGPGKCDKWGCYPGTVQLTGTQNCTKCFRGCSRCSHNDPTQCTSCRYRLYLDSATKQCRPCNSACRYCRNSADFCYSCIRGYQLVNNTCVKVPSNCVSLNNQGQCSACFKGYWLNGTFCSPDVSCNGNSSCQICPLGYYQSVSTCQPCTLSSNCIACDSTNITECKMCNIGYYLHTISNTCNKCAFNCLECDDYDECTVAKDGYYVPQNDDGESIGWAKACQSPCATCSTTADFCKSCKVGYTINGSQCRQNFYLMITMVLGPRSTGSIILSSQSQAQQMFNALRSLNRVGNAINALLPSAFNDGRDWRERLRFLGITVGSVIPVISLDAGNYVGTNTQASTDVTNSLANGDMDGLSYISSSIEAVGSPASAEESSTKLALILGITIPLVLILTLVIVMLIRKWYLAKQDEDESEQAEQFEKKKEEFSEKDKNTFQQLEPNSTPEVKEVAPAFKRELSIEGSSVDEKMQTQPAFFNHRGQMDEVSENRFATLPANQYELDIKEGESDFEAMEIHKQINLMYQLGIEGSESEEVITNAPRHPKTLEVEDFGQYHAVEVKPEKKQAKMELQIEGSSDSSEGKGKGGSNEAQIMDL